MTSALERKYDEDFTHEETAHEETERAIKALNRMFPNGAKEDTVSKHKVLEVLEDVLDNHPNSQEFVEDIMRRLEEVE